MALNQQTNRPPLDQEVLKKLETATLAMGCFWSPDALFGSVEGVVRTRVGYAGGTSENPSYRNMGEHIESLQLEYDPAVIGYADLLELFFSLHKPIREPWKRQYASALFYHNKEQQRLISEKIGDLEHEKQQKIFTEVQPYSAFWLAEERHQKYKLQRQPELLAEFRQMYPDWHDLINSTAAARVNGYLYSCKSCEKLLLDLGSFGLSERGQKILLDTATTASGVACSRALK